jgi:phosphate transport system protein
MHAQSRLIASGHPRKGVTAAGTEEIRPPQAIGVANSKWRNFAYENSGPALMVELRRHFHERLRHAETELLRMGRIAGGLFARSLDALHQSDLAFAVIDGDEEVEPLGIVIERQILELFALETPVAGDLRLLTTMLHLAPHLERVGDIATNIARIAWLTRALPRDGAVLAHVDEMGSLALGLLEAATAAFVRRDLALAHRLPAMDEPIDRLNRGMMTEVMRASANTAMLEWAIPMHLAARLIERVGDHAVDMGERVGFLVTGVFQEFTDASHDVVVDRWEPPWLDAGDMR